MCIVISVLLIGVLGLTFFPGFTSETKQLYITLRIEQFDR